MSPIPYPIPQPAATDLAQPQLQSVVDVSNAPVAAASAPSTQRKPLAQPMGGTWSSRHDTATQKTQSLKTLKIQQHEIEEHKKRTIMLIIYYVVSFFFIDI